MFALPKPLIYTILTTLAVAMVLAPDRAWGQSQTNRDRPLALSPRFVPLNQTGFGGNQSPTNGKLNAARVADVRTPESSTKDRLTKSGPVKPAAAEIALSDELSQAVASGTADDYSLMPEDTSAATKYAHAQAGQDEFYPQSSEVILAPAAVGYSGRSAQSCYQSVGCIGYDVWARTDYLMMWTKSADLPPLASTGILGQTGTALLFGGNDVDVPKHDGGRVTLGFWQSPDHCLGWQFSYLGLSNTRTNFGASSNAFPDLSQPFINAVSGQEDTAIVAAPGSQTGLINIGLSNRLQAADALVRWNLDRTQCERLDLLLGYQFASMSESLAIDSSTTFNDPAGLQTVGTRISSSDRFGTRNSFHGVQLGLATSAVWGAWSVELSPRVALGNNYSRIRVDGSTLTEVPQTNTASAVGGIYALPTNIGTTSKNSFACIPQFNARLTRRLSSRLDLSLGYTFLYWSDLARPGQQIDRRINPTQFPPGPLVGAASPASKSVHTDFWAQGISFGGQFRF